MNRTGANIEKDMLQGNINRMFITDSIEELNNRFIYALKNLEKIHTYNHERLLSIKKIKEKMKYEY